MSSPAPYDRLSSTPIPAEITTEKNFETRFVIPVVLRVSAQHKDVYVYSHPWNNRPAVNQIVRLLVSIGKQWSGARDAGQKARSGHRFWHLVHITPSIWSQRMRQKKTCDRDQICSC